MKLKRRRTRFTSTVDDTRAAPRLQSTSSYKRRRTRSISTLDDTRAAPRVQSTSSASFLSHASSTSVHGGEFNASQRDIIIINNHIGGSDSDTSRSTLAVSNSITSGSIGDPPHASTSSSVRDLPCLSASPASNQEQNSPEESNVSTDSGLGETEVSPEIESPPTEEGDPVKKESSNSIYQRRMYLEAHGFPLWIPQPNMSLPCSYQRQGVSIGDVGIFTLDGGFDFLFNVCLPAGHPSNPEVLPAGFVPLELKPTDVCKLHAHLSHSHLVSPSVKSRNRATFECSGSDGAILAMPQGAYHEDLRNIRTFREYASIHVKSWYLYANGPSNGREIGNGELHLVTGCDKTTSWGMATYSHVQSKRSEDNVSLLRLNPVDNEHHGRHSSYTMYEWDYEGVVEAKFGPERSEDELADLGVSGSAPPRDQCTFIRSLTPAFGKDDWKHLESDVASLVKDQASVRSPESPFPSNLGGTTSSLPGRISFLRGHRRGGSSEMTDSMTPAQITAAHPATYVVDMMLRKCPKAKVVVVHDSDWCSVIRDSDVDWMYTAQDLSRRIQEAFHIVEEKNGTVYLEEKARPCQDLSTSSDISVRAEVEDGRLLGNRKLWPSQLSDPFETSPSDIEGGSPRSLKKIVDGNEDIQSHTSHGSGEDDDNDLGGEDLVEDRKSRSSQNIDSFEISSSVMNVDSSRFSKKSVDDWGHDIKPSEKYHYPSEDEDELCDEDNLQPDVFLLEFIFHQVQKAKNKDSFKESFSAPRSLKMSVDDSNLDSSDEHLSLEMVHKEFSWTDTFLEYISLQIQKLRKNPSYNNKFSVNHDSSQGPFQLDTNDSDNTHHVMLNTIIKVMFQQLDSIEELADDDDDVAKSDVFEAPAQVKYSEGNFVHRAGESHIEVPSDDEVDSMSNAILPVPTPQTYIWQNTDGVGAVPYNAFSSSSGPSTDHLPLEKELSGGIVSAVNSLDHHAPESSTVTQPHETSFPLFWDDRNPLLFAKSLEPGDAAGDRDDTMSYWTFGTEHGTSTSSFLSDRGPGLLADEDLPVAHSQSAGGTSTFTNPFTTISDLRGTDLLAEKDLPLAHSQSAGGLTTSSTLSQFAANNRRRKPGREMYICSLCGADFTAKHNLKHHTNSHFGRKTHSCNDCGEAFGTRYSLKRHGKVCRGPKTKASLGSTQQSNQLEDHSIMGIERPMSGAAPRGDE